MGKNVLYTNAELRSLIIPMFFSTLLFISVGAADSMMVASLGAESVSGVALVDMVNILLGGMLAALSTGGAVVASQYLGAGRPKDGNDSAKQLLFISELFSITLSLLCIFGKRFSRIKITFFNTLKSRLQILVWLRRFGAGSQKYYKCK